MKRFIPNTPHINEDRRYFIDGRHFIKEDQNINRGQHEAEMLRGMPIINFVPSFVSSCIMEGGWHRLITMALGGETLENCKDKLTNAEKYNVAHELIRIVNEMMYHGIIHGDLNESNVLYERVKGRIYLVDWETGQQSIGTPTDDIYGPPWGLIHLLNYLRK